MRGIILAGGSGTRLHPLTQSVSKQLLPIYDKPLIYYPLSTLMLGGIQEILIISTPQDTPRIEQLLGNGERLGLQLSYRIQEEPKGISQAFLIGEDFIKKEPVALILGDNIFYGNRLGQTIAHAFSENIGATLFGYFVKNPEAFGVLEFKPHSTEVIGIEEKPTQPKSNWAAVGLYVYDGHVVEKTKSLRPSARGELEITDLNKIYLKEKSLKAQTFGRGYAWLDAGTHESLIRASNFVKAVEDNQGLKIACLEEIALRQSFISREDFLELAIAYPASGYGEYLKQLAERECD